MLGDTSCIIAWQEVIEKVSKKCSVLKTNLEASLCVLLPREASCTASKSNQSLYLCARRRPWRDQFAHLAAHPPLQGMGHKKFAEHQTN